MAPPLGPYNHYISCLVIAYDIAIFIFIEMSVIYFFSKLNVVKQTVSVFNSCVAIVLSTECTSITDAKEINEVEKGPS